MEPPETAVFSFLDVNCIVFKLFLKECAMKNLNFNIREKNLYDDLVELIKTTKVRPKPLNGFYSYQFTKYYKR